MNKKIFLIFLLAFLIRLIAINQSLWLDEAIVAKVARDFSFLDIITKFSPTDFHPPLYYLFMKVWTNMFGYSEVALRFPSIIFSLLTGYVIYKIVSLFDGSIIKEYSVALFLFNPLIVYYSQEARMYMMATFLLTTGLYYLLSSLRVNELKNKLLFGLSISLAFLTFYGSIFLIAAMMLYLLIKKQYRFFILNTCYLILTTLLVSPLLYHQLINSKVALSQVTNWTLVLGKANLKDLALIPVKFSIGRISFYPKWLYWLIAGSWTIAVFFVMFKNLIIKNSLKIENFKLKIILIYLIIFSLSAGFVISFFAPMMQYFRFIYLIPIVSLVLGINNLPSRHDRAKMVTNAILLFGFITFSLIYLLFPQFHREDWKGLVASLPKNRPIYMIKASSDPVTYYSNSLKVNDLSLIRQGSGEQASLSSRITVIPYSAGVYGLDYKSLLVKSGYRLVKEHNFREVTYEDWIK